MLRLFYLIEPFFDTKKNTLLGFFHAENLAFLMLNVGKKFIEFNALGKLFFTTSFSNEYDT